MQSFSTSPNTDQAFIDFFFPCLCIPVVLWGWIPRRSPFDTGTLIQPKTSTPTVPPPSCHSTPSFVYSSHWPGGQCTKDQWEGWQYLFWICCRHIANYSYWTVLIICIWPPSSTLVKNKENKNVSIEEGWWKMKRVAELRLGCVKWYALEAKFKEKYTLPVEPMSSLLIS